MPSHHPLTSLSNSLFFGNINGICMVLGTYVMDANLPEGKLAAHPGVIWLANNIGDNYDGIKRECKKHGVRLNDIFGKELA